MYYIFKFHSLGAGGREFESRYPDKKINDSQTKESVNHCFFLVLFFRGSIAGRQIDFYEFTCPFSYRSMALRMSSLPCSMISSARSKSKVE